MIFKKQFQMNFIKQMTWLLCVVFLTVSVSPMAGVAEETKEHMEEERRNTYMTLEDETLEEDKVPSIALFSLDAQTSADIPSAYRSDQVSVNGVRVSYLPDGFREQGTYGSCWTFSALGACEASLIRKGYADNTIDLSERQLLYYFYNKGETADERGGTWGDYNTVYPSTASWVNRGGNGAYTMWHLASWCGPVDESLAPYSGLTSAQTDDNGLCGQPNSAQMAYDNDICHVQNVYKVSLGDMAAHIADKQTVKQLVMEYGAVAMGYYSADVYDCPAYDSYYNDTYTTTNHAVQIVGWDDAFPKTQFRNEAPGDGAWLIKNSWGDETETKAQDGYFWISYYDASINGYTKSSGEYKAQYAYVFDAEPADNYDHIYQYDGDSMAGSISFTSQQPIGMRFVAGEGLGKKECLQSVGIGVAQSGVTGTIEIYTNLYNESGDPTCGNKVLSQEFALTYPGYHTIPLEKDIYLEDGSQFSVVFRMDQKTAVYVSYDYTGSFVKFDTYENPDVNFWYTGSMWKDMKDTSVGMIARMKAYTDDTEMVSPMLKAFVLNEDNVAMTAGETLQLKAEASFTGTEENIWKQHWISSNTDVAIVSSQGVVTARNAGTAEITVYNGKIKDVCTVFVTEPLQVGGENAASGTGDGNTEEPNSSETQTSKPKDAGTGADGTVEEEVSVEKPKKVSLSYVTLKDSGKIKLAWKKISGASGYEVYRATSKDGTYKKIKTIKKASKVSVELAASNGSKPYYYKVRAYKIVDGQKIYGAFSARKTAGPGAVSNLRSRTYKGKKIKLTWEKSDRTSGYVIYRATSPNGTYKKIKTIANAKTENYTDSSLNAGKTYYYKIRAYRVIKGTKVYGPYTEIVSAKAKK